MSIDTTTTLATAALYTPFRGVRRSGVVGTLHARMGATGDGSGGTVAIQLSMVGDEFGFPLLFVPTLIGAESPNQENPVLTYQAGIERIGGQGGEFERVLIHSVGNARNIAERAGSSPHISVVFNPDQPAVEVLQVIWATNTTSGSYTVNLYAMCYDQQEMAKMQELMLEGPIAGPL